MSMILVCHPSRLRSASIHHDAHPSKQAEVQTQLRAAQPGSRIDQLGQCLLATCSHQRIFRVSRCEMHHHRHIGTQASPRAATNFHLNTWVVTSSLALPWVEEGEAPNASIQ